MRKLARNHSPDALRNARRLRREMSVSEKVFWELVRKDRLGFRFHRQVPMGPFTLDFYCPAARLAVEIDGDQHNVVRDEARDLYLEREDVLTIRVSSDVLFGKDASEAERVLKRIREALGSRSRR